MTFTSAISITPGWKALRFPCTLSSLKMMLISCVAAGPDRGDPRPSKHGEVGFVRVRCRSRLGRPHKVVSHVACCGLRTESDAYVMHHTSIGCGLRATAGHL
jgi:hypothetical protein